MNGEKYWVPVRMKDNNVVTAEGPYTHEQSRRARREALATLGTRAEVGIPFQADTKAEALEAAQQQVGIP